MWAGGVRAVIPDGKGRILLVRQRHEDRDVWMLPGGAIEDGENAAEAVVREVREETGLDVKSGPMLWHVEEVSDRGQRFVNVFLAEITGGEAALGADPEFGSDEQVLRELGFFSEEEIAGLTRVYPETLRGEIWEILRAAEEGRALRDAFRVRRI